MWLSNKRYNELISRIEKLEYNSQVYVPSNQPHSSFWVNDILQGLIYYLGIKWTVSYAQPKFTKESEVGEGK